MSSSEESPLEREPLVDLNCGACPKMIRLDARGELLHADGTELCLAEDRVFPSLDMLDNGDRQVPPKLGDPDLPPWAPLETSHRLRIEPAEERGRVPSGFAVAAIAILTLLIALGCVAYAILGLRAAGVELP